MNGIAEAMQAAYDNALTTQALASPEPVGVWCAPQSNRITFSPGSFEIAGEHGGQPSAAGATISVSAALRLCTVEEESRGGHMPLFQKRLG
ncbi:hypothetical protein [Occallatibacter riparius]|uniref:Uncharacterized protein n=1 Tax=Occallatibacter riparius TaxID=1002689 RepID=A0A9J7BWD9_9BACT|nr:hypothetical protein [Occallatibacter riparius]UWZ86952.1 hypothetical protein MOP44_13610 [Occallatibacter riparius]